jgi:pimeloyl-ACP methyl ester carboxylesterase
MTSALWSAVAGSIGADVDIRVLELPGHGTQPPAAGFTIEQLAARALETLPTSQAPVILAGHSMGGAVALEMVQRAPTRFSGLAMMCSSDRFGDEHGWRSHIATVHSEGIAAVATGAPDEWFTSEFAHANPSLVEEFSTSLRRVDEASYLACCEALAAYDGSGTLREINVPSVFITGMDDRSTSSANMRRMAGETRNGAFLAVAGSHLAPVESADVVAVALRDLIPVNRSETRKKAS